MVIDLVVADPDVGRRCVFESGNVLVSDVRSGRYGASIANLFTAVGASADAD